MSGENLKPVALFKTKTGVNRQRRNKSSDQILCLSSINVHRNTHNDSDLYSSCITGDAVVFK